MGGRVGQPKQKSVEEMMSGIAIAIATTGSQPKPIAMGTSRSQPKL